MPSRDGLLRAVRTPGIHRTPGAARRRGIAGPGATGDLRRIGVRGLVGACILLVLLVPRTAYAYTDPATGSMILQLLAAGFVTFAFFFRKTIARLAGIFRPGRKDSQPAPGPEQKPDK